MSGKIRRMVFSGSVLPLRGNVTLLPQKLVLREYPDYPITISINRSDVQVVADWPSERMNLFHMRTQVEGAVMSLVDVVGYMVQCGYDVQIHSAVDCETGEHTVFGVGQPIEVKNEYPELPDNLPDLVSDNPLRLAFANFREAIRVPNDTSYFCFRAIESIRQAFGNSSKNINGTWDNMRSALNLSRSTLDEFSDCAIPLRHGDFAEQAWPVRKRHMEIAHEVIRRYHHYKAGEAATLSTDKFPIF